MADRRLASILISLNSLVAVFRAFLANRLGNNKWIPLPPVAHSIDTSWTIDELVTKVDNVVRPAILNTAHPCLYYSYARCRVLRKYGYSIQLNIGLHNLHPGQNTEGHCWISRMDQVLFEDKDPHEMYPDKIGERDDVIYWGRLTAKGGKNFRRDKKL